MKTVICKRCKKERKHYAKELCRSCYQQIMNKKNPNLKDNLKRWQKKNLKYWRDYIPNSNYYKNKHPYKIGSNQFRKELKEKSK